MKLQDLREMYEYFSQKTSEIVRQLGFAGIAVIWVFKTDAGGKQALPPALIQVGVLIVVGLCLDLLHAVTGTAVWGIYNRNKEQALERKRKHHPNFDPEEEDFLAPPKINWPALFFFWSKILAISAAYVLLIIFLFRRFIQGAG